MQLSERLAMLRKAKDIQQKELAIHLRLSVSTVSNYENGAHQPNLDTLRRLADFYGVSTDYLLGRTSHPAPVPYPYGKNSNLRHRERLFFEMENLSPDNLHTLECIIKIMKHHEIAVSNTGHH